MTVPDYQNLLLPLLRLAADGQVHSLQEAADSLAEQFHLTPDDLRELLPSGSQPKFSNRVSWSRTYLTKAQLLEKAARARFRITDRGRDLLRQNPDHIDVDLLMRYPEFVEFRARKPVTPREEGPGAVEGTPDDTLAESYIELRDALAQELLERARSCSPNFFEQLVVDLLVAMGYGGSRKDAGQAIGRSGDGGIDGIIKEDRLGLDTVYVQAKRWEGTVGRPVVQTFAGSLEGQRARKGVMITTSSFSADARKYVENIEKKIVLIDGEQLAQHMIDYNVGVTEVARYIVKKADSDYFGE